MRTLITICARGGSKGLPGKNLKLLNKKPLIAHTIDLALSVPGNVDIVVSSDSDNILKVAKSYGVENTVKRPSHLASDEAGKLPAILHCLEAIEAIKKLKYDYVVDLDVTSPLRKLSDVMSCLAIIEQNHNISNLITATPSRKSPYFNVVEIDETTQVPKLAKSAGVFLSRQAAPKTFDMNASIYIWRREFIERDGLFHNDTYCHVMPESRSIDIDNLIDFMLVETLLSANENIFSE